VSGSGYNRTAHKPKGTRADSTHLSYARPRNWSSLDFLAKTTDPTVIEKCGFCDAILTARDRVVRLHGRRPVHSECLHPELKEVMSN
jgi:hypothetical protein